MRGSWVGKMKCSDLRYKQGARITNNLTEGICNFSYERRLKLLKLGISGY